MASSSQHRCVFVGNIPYDATEEQLIDICREVGPVVSFRLVIDRETGKPKGYGFCEYKDEETALSARRNLQGYQINGRQLRVDFAENDKNADRNREQGRGGPGMVATSDPQKQLGGPAIHGESTQHQPIGLHIAITAATVMAGALGGPQLAIQSSQTGLQGQSALASDPLTLHLAKMSRAQLNEIISGLKVMAQQNREAAQQLLLARPQLSKALFQAQIMLGLVTPQVLQMPNIRQPSGQSVVSLPQDVRQGLHPVVQNVPMLSSLARQGQVPILTQNTLSQNQLSVASQPPLQPQTLVSRYTGNLPPQHVALPGQSGVPPLPPAHPSIRQQIQAVNSLSSNQQMQPSVMQHAAQGASSLRRSSQTLLPNAPVKSSIQPHLSVSDSVSQKAPPISSGTPQAVGKVADRSTQQNNAFNIHKSSANDTREQSNRPSKLLKLDDRSSTVLPGSSSASDASGSGPSKVITVNSMPVNSFTKPEESTYVEKQSSQLQLSSDVESALLQQVLSLTPEQLSSLPPEQQQQVIQLQQALRQDQLQAS